MRDPFQQNTNRQLVREAQFGFTVIGLLVATLIYVAWFRLSGLDDITPDHIRNSPVAQQIFPNSPNYDRENHRMLPKQRTSFATDDVPKQLQPGQFQPVPQQSNQFQPRRVQPKQDLVTVPKRVMDESQLTGRSLQTAAKSIEKTASKVSTLTNSLSPKKPFGLVSNPATQGDTHSGFKVLKAPESDIATKKRSDVDSAPASNQFNPKPKAKAVSTPLLPSPPKFGSPNFGMPNLGVPKVDASTQPKVDPPKVDSSKDFNPGKALPAVTLPPFNLKPVKLPSNEQEPLEVQPAEPKSDAPNLFGPSKALDSAKSIPRLPKLPQQTLKDLRAPKLELNEPELNEPNKNPVADVIPDPKPSAIAFEPVVKTVSFEKSTWIVKKGDSYYSIAQSNYGDGRFFRALFEHNRHDVPGFENLTEGVEIDLPGVEELVQNYSFLCPADAVRKHDPLRKAQTGVTDELTEACEEDLENRFYKTKSGDTLFEIARRQLGQASRYIELIELNQFRIDSDVTHESELPSGIKLLLPKK